jgi:citrate synthase
MREGVLFEITKDHLETGLRGYPVGYCVTSHVDPQKGLSYIGRPVSELSNRDPEEVIYLLYHGETGTPAQVAQFYQELSRRSVCKEETIQHILSLPRAGRPMDVYACAILIAGMYESSGNYREDCLNIIAKIPHITALVINSHAGWGETPTPRPELGYMENFVSMLRQPVNKSAELIQVFRLFNILSFDHGGGNLSTFVGKAVASGLENMYGSLAASMTALAGPRHGKANQECLEFAQKILKQIGPDATAQDIEQSIRKKVENHEVIVGFGHAVLRVEDPRASVCYQYCQKYFSDHPLVKIAQLIRTEGSRVLKENPKISDPYPNIDAITGVMLTAAGFPYPEYYTVLFGLARCVGIAIQIVYERTQARDGKGTPIVRPSYIYKHRI